MIDSPPTFQGLSQSLNDCVQTTVKLSVKVSVSFRLVWGPFAASRRNALWSPSAQDLRSQAMCAGWRKSSRKQR